MNDAEFLKKLKEFDPDMADRWQKATGGKLASRIDGKKLEAILGPTFATGKITAKQARAIDFLFVWSWMHFTKEAKAILWQGIEDAYILDYFFAGSKAQLASNSQLKDFNGAIGGSAGVIDFTSPPKDGTGLTYSADQYLAIKQLVSESKITVFEVDAAFLHAKAGFYRSDIDRLILYTGAWPVLRQFTTVHEVTHAIQDWNDVVANHEFCEADAYIAAAAAALAVDRSTFDSMKEYPAQQKAAELVVELAQQGIVAQGNRDRTARLLAGHRGLGSAGGTAAKCGSAGQRLAPAGSFDDDIDDGQAGSQELRLPFCGGGCLASRAS